MLANDAVTLGMALQGILDCLFVNNPGVYHLVAGVQEDRAMQVIIEVKCPEDEPEPG